ncbi:Glycerophosphoryl diester phosphodiesterase family protein [Neorhizobium galegae bv. orientalis]|nr:Glycerophosphoryl diester phosphodiesterase family protein [Neorhizobium galegae bv. orientalis]
MNPLRMNLETLRVGGHRGHSAGAPENTLAAFRKAFDHGGPLATCETDLSMTADGELVLMHDKTVDRTTDGHGIVQTMTYADLSKLDAGSWFGPEFACERVPSLREALELGRELGILYQLELKIYDRNEVIIPKLRALIDEMDCADLLQFSSFDFVQLKAAKEAIPEVPTVGLMHSRLIDPAALARQAKLDAMNIEIYHFASGESRQLHDEGIAVFTYLPGGHHEKMMKYGVDVEDQIVRWVREGELDQLMGDDVAQMARLRNRARG